MNEAQESANALRVNLKKTEGERDSKTEEYQELLSKSQRTESRLKSTREEVIVLISSPALLLFLMDFMFIAVG